MLTTAFIYEENHSFSVLKINVHQRLLNWLKKDNANSQKVFSFYYFNLILLQYRTFTYHFKTRDK